MEPERIDQEPSFARSPSRLHQVTPLSKYLAMVLFTILPFVGGWIGYTYAPEKIVEVERIVYEEVNDTSENTQEKRQLTPSSYLEGNSIYTTYGAQTEVMFSNVDVDSFAAVPDFENYRYRPIADGGYSPRWFEDKNYFYCIQGRGQPNAVKLNQPINITLEPLSVPFDSSDGLSLSESNSWQDTDSNEFGDLYFVNSETDQRFDIQCQDVSNWITYENDWFTLSHPADCRIKDFSALYSEAYPVVSDVSTLSGIGVCDVTHDSLGGVRVTSDSVEEVIAQQTQLANSNPNQTLMSVFKTTIGNYTAQNMKFRNESTQLEYSTVLFSENGNTFVISGTDSYDGRWDMKKILSTIEVK